MKRLTLHTLTALALAPVGAPCVSSQKAGRIRSPNPRDMDRHRSGERRVRPSLRWLSVLLIFAFSGCSLFFGKRKPTTYVTPEGYAGALAQKGPYVLDAVYMDDSTRGLEGVVRLTWWNVFSVTVQNRSRSDISIPDSAFTLVDGEGVEHKALTLAQVLGYESHVIGPLMSYQRRAIRRAFWSSNPIVPGAFAVGYIFFPRKSSLYACQLVLDPNPEKRKDELVAVFGIAPPPSAVPEAEGVEAEADTTAVPPVPSDTTGVVSDTVQAPVPPAELPEQVPPSAPDEGSQPAPDVAPAASPSAGETEGQAAPQGDAGETTPEQAPNTQDVQPATTE